MQVAQAPPQPSAAALEAQSADSLLAMTLAACQQPAATVLTAPITHTMTTTSAVSGRLESATVPAAASIAAAAS